MSKILRRPMFRGGGQVSSYGKGIAAPLVQGYQMGGRIPGYQMGGNVSGGIVNLPGGYAQTANQRLLNNINKDFPNLNVANSGNITLGSELLAAASNKFPKSNAPIPGVVQEDKTTTTATEIQDVDTNAVDGSTLNEDFDQTESKIVIDPVTGEKKTIQAYVPAEEVKPSAKVLRNLNMITKEEYDILKNKEELEVIQKRIDSEESGNKQLRPGGEDAGSLTVSEIEELGLTQAEKDAQNITESPEISAKDAIRENQELFKELLGSKKARGQDISDMLLRFSGSQGNTVGEKFQNYTRAESAAGPGRGEKINQTAAALAINDYVAGKRSKEQVEGMKSQIDYKAKVEGERTKVLPGEDWRGALAKTSLRTKESSGSTGVIRDTLKDLFKKPVATIETTLTKIDKNNGKDLAVGFNIVTGKDGKFIIEKFTDGTYKARTDLLI
jgi:hypothetical protein